MDDKNSWLLLPFGRKSMELSKRLKAIADKVKPHSKVADIGTDHGYIPIYLVKNRQVDKVIAMDINKDPLKKCQSNVEAYGVSDRIETRLSDGVKNLNKNEVDTMIIAGMGGKLICNIIEAGKEVVESIETLIISPHTDIKFVRSYIVSLNRTFVEEVIKDEDHLYHIFTCSNEEYKKNSNEQIEALHLQFGKEPIVSKNPVYLEYLESYLVKQELLLNELKKKNVQSRVDEIEKVVDSLRQVIKWMKY